jgi:hypothetical protein
VATPYFGLVPRTTATLLTEVSYAGFVLLALWGRTVDPELMSLMLIVLLAGIGGMVFDVYRYVLTEFAIMRIHDRLSFADAA